MRYTMHKKDLLYKDGFPANIDREKLVVVQITKQSSQGVVLYVCKETGKQSRSFLPSVLGEKYSEGIYIIR